jgi:two-component system nitrogen regulation response regulator GlnG
MGNTATSVRATVWPRVNTAETEEDAAKDERLPIIGRSPAMQNIYRTLARLMPTDLSVMIVGESGTGKELVARALHDYGKRRNGPFVAINMAAIPKDLIESELFGHEKGAFTGARTRGVGCFEQAEGGTLFLDEIGGMPPEAQTRLLRVLQDSEDTIVGGHATIRANARIIASTHMDLRQLIRHGLFREDLYSRLNVVPIRLPPLRERTDDIPELVNHFLARAAAESLPQKSINNEAMERLKTYHWPGNVREIKNLMQLLSVLCAEERITLEAMEAVITEASPALAESGESGLSHLVKRHLKTYFSAHGETLPSSGLYGRVLREIERPLIDLTLSATQGNQIKAAQVLGLNRNTLRKKIRELNIPVVRGRK